ncbi:3-hydroxyacyl-ACP dehydratase FabZ family protein [Geothrix sp. SG200]|uniref:3-hydroxyacyl-ACP dehydratase FabZ family protein n=1 Tax=Geothrix sp. SG200 TaxID=2922865 RepID=UPI001FACB790|nr:3-hydroxyacyl-ACP dehydratase FabZ family protein [Geothrix sp. SG200]
MDILAHLPHRAPLLLVDRLLEREPGLRVVAEKLVTADEPYLLDHPAGGAQVPGPLLLEMLAQAGGFLEAETLHGASIFLAGVRDARFHAPAVPGDRLRLEVAAEGAFAGLMRLQCAATCEGRDLCTATLLVKRL